MLSKEEEVSDDPCVTSVRLLLPAPLFILLSLISVEYKDDMDVIANNVYVL